MKSDHREYILKNIDQKSAKEIAKELGIKERAVQKFLGREKEKETFGGEREKSIRRADRFKIGMSIALIALWGVAVYANALNGQFLWDDDFLVVKNGNIRSFANLGHVFLRDTVSKFGREFGFYRPLQEFTYMIDYALWELNPVGYHFTNVLIHVGVAWAVFWLLNLLYGHWRLSLLTSLLYVVFPLHTEAVTYIAGRADPLAALFMLLCMIFYIKNLSAPNIGYFALMLVSYVCALLSRENSMVFPALVLAYHFSFRKKIDRKAFFSLLAVLGVYMLLRLTVFSYLNVASVYTTTLPQRLPGFLAALASYLRLLVVPFDLHMAYGNKVIPMTDPRVAVGIVILGAASFVMLKGRKDRGLVFFSLSWFFISMFPHSNVFPIVAYMYEHFLYFPSIGLFAIFASGLLRLHRVERFKKAAEVLMISILLFYSYLTFQQNRTWIEPLAFYERIIRYAPDSTEVNNNLGILYNALGRKEEAIQRFEKAIESNPRFAEAYNNLGNLYKDAGRGEDAIRTLEKAIAIDPLYPEAYANLGVTYFGLGEKEKAISFLGKAIELNPNFAEGYNNLSAVYFYSQDYPSAIRYYDRSKELGLDNPGLSKLLEPYR